MGAPDLLRHLRDDGLVLTLTPAGGLHVAPRRSLTDDHRAAIRAARDALIQALQAEATRQPSLPSPKTALPRRSSNPLMTPEQADDCHAEAWDDAEIDAFRTREARFARLGQTADAEHLAERLTLRDRQQDDRRMCLECAALADTGRCLAAERGRLPSASRRLEPVPTILRRCGGLTLAPGLA